MPDSATYEARRGQLHQYFDHTASAAWARLTSDAPVSGIRATVRAGRSQMRTLLLDWLPRDLRGARLLDAGCGTGALAVEAANRGAEVLAVDLAGSLVQVARDRIQTQPCARRITFAVGDFADARHGQFDFVVAMDSLIHYDAPDIVRVVAELAPRTTQALCLTFAPRTAALAAMHAVGRLFPRADRAPAIVPVREQHLRSLLACDPALQGLEAGRSARVATGFYTSQALELARA